MQTARIYIHGPDKLSIRPPPNEHQVLAAAYSKLKSDHQAGGDDAERGRLKAQVQEQQVHHATHTYELDAVSSSGVLLYT